MKNSIWYRFSSEKESYQITFDTTDISIIDIKQKIIRRRNMIKFPEEFDLIFYDEENPLVKIEDKDLIKPMKHLIVKRLPRYYNKRTNFVKIIREPKDFFVNKNNENIIRKDELQQIKRYKEPLEKISKYLKKEIIYKQFKCKLCEKLDEESYNNFIITLCCKETFCLNCYNKDNEKCPFCKEQKKGYVKNEAENNLIKKLFDILEKKEELEKMQKAQELIQNNNKNNNLNSVNDINQKNFENNNPNNNNNNSINNNILNSRGTNQVLDPLKSYQLQKQLMEGSQFYIIKSSNVENIEKSKTHSVWATTISNSNRLNQAFNKGKVILIFSVNGAQLFKGYAIMTSFSAETQSNIWQLENNIKLGGDFTVSWLCYCELPFLKTKQLQVNKSRDCTELDINTGAKLCELCFEQEKEELERMPKRSRIEINEQLINKINEDIINNKNKQKQKMNNNNINNNKQQQINNEVNKIGLNNNNNINIEQNPNQIQNTQPIYPQFRPVYYIPFIPNQFPQMQQKQQEMNNPNIMMPMMANQAQVQQKKENEKKENIKEEHKKKSRHTKRRSRSRDKSRNRNKSRSSRSRRSNSSNSSRDEKRSKYSKSNK